VSDSIMVVVAVLGAAVVGAAIMLLAPASRA
jgi:hypothetical protein